MVLRDLAPDLFRFGRFTLEPQRRRLCVDGVPVALSSRAFDILLLLVENRDRVVTKDEIFARVWPGTIVEENNLAVQISALRRALGEAPGDPKLIATVPGRGYRFVGLLEDAGGLDAEPAPPLPPLQLATEMVATRFPKRHSIAWITGATALAIVLGAVGTRYALREAPAPPRLSIAVLPFRNLSADPHEDTLTASISHDLAADLARIPGSTVKRRETGGEVEEIGHSANVRYVFQGSLTIESDAFNVNAELIDAQNGNHICCSRFNVARDTLGADREQIVRRIASMLNARLIQIEAARSLREDAADPDALDFYLRARSTLDHGNTMANLQDAQILMERAAKADYATSSDADSELGTAISAELGMILLKKFDFGDDENLEADHAEARKAIEAALAKSSHAPVAITANGMLALANNRCDEALSRFESAKELDPNEVRAMEGFALCSRQLGHMADMIAELKKILTVDPASPDNAHREQLIGLGLLLLGRTAEAKDWLDRSGAGLTDTEDSKSPSLEPGEWRRIYLIAAAELGGDHANAVKLYIDYSRRFPNRSVWRLGTYFTHALVQQPGSQKFLDALFAAGMPRYLADEEKDFHISKSASSQSGGDFDPTPTAISGGKTIQTEALRTLRIGTSKPVIIDVGRGAGLIRGAHWVWAQGIWVDQNSTILQYIERDGATPDSTIVVMGDNLLGWDAYNAGRFLIARGYRNVLWYRGGEEAWAAHGYESDDKRPM
jgi:DNA-binding winged helix-turn-helix (wHTH) protein/TolB-like protein